MDQLSLITNARQSGAAFHALGEFPEHRNSHAVKVALLHTDDPYDRIAIVEAFYQGFQTAAIRSSSINVASA